MNDILKLLRNHLDRTVAAALVIGGLAAIVIGWIAVSDTILTFEQIPYVMSGGLFGVCLVALGASLWLSADIRDEWRKLDRLEEAVRGGRPWEDEASDASVTEPAVTTEPGRPRLRVSAKS